MNLFPLDAQQQPLATIKQGQLAGTTTENITTFKGIPYAAPPVGDLRWKAPQPAAAWQGTRQAVNFESACMQPGNPFTDVPGQTRSEDCLYLNVWSPATHQDDDLPVLVWIHGGGFSFGSTAQAMFDGTELAKKGVVFVSMAYRLGPFGFFAHPELSAETEHNGSGNYGLLDQIAALQWVQDNIRQFGGNPDNVTIMGESAGAISVSLLVASPLTRGLFHKAIAESGASFGNICSNGNDGQSIKPLADAESLGAEFSQLVGAKSIEDLRALPAQTVLERMPKLSAFVMQSSWPICDDYVIAGDPVTRYQSSQHNDTPVLIGSNAAEGSLFFYQESLDNYIDLVKRSFGEHAENILTAFPAENDQQALISRQDLFRDLVFAWHSWTWAKLQTQHSQGPVYSYYFNHTPPSFPNMPSLGPTHAAEMPYVFNLLLPPLAWRDNDKQLAEQMSSYWINFAKNGDPNGEGLPAWPQWDNQTQQVMHFNTHPSIGSVANLEQLQAIDDFFSDARKCSNLD